MIDDAGPSLPHWRDLLALGFDAVKQDGRLRGDAPCLAQAAEISDAAPGQGLCVLAEGVEDEAALTLPIWLTTWQARRQTHRLAITPRQD